MENKLLFGLFALVFLVQIPFVFSYNCTEVPSAVYDLCYEVNASGISSWEKNVIINTIVESYVNPPEDPPRPEISICEIEGIEIKTDKLKYKNGEEIKVSVFSGGRQVKLEYSGRIRYTNSEAIFTAEYPYNKITATYDCLTVQKVIYPQERDRFKIIADLTIFGFLNIFFYKVLTKGWRKIYGL
jgi:hypothetical protein